MVTRTEIRAFVESVVARFNPTRIILFGSYAAGRPTRDSGVDLMVVMPHRGPAARVATRIRLACPRSFPMDLIVRSPAEVRRRLAMDDPFLSEITSKGVVLHEMPLKRSRFCARQITSEA
jgi:predicted nucleotidyltransferase